MHYVNVRSEKRIPETTMCVPMSHVVVLRNGQTVRMVAADNRTTIERSAFYGRITPMNRW